MNLEFYLVAAFITLLTTLTIFYVQFDSSLEEYCLFLTQNNLIYFLIIFSILWVISITALLIGLLLEIIISFYTLVKNLYHAVGEMSEINDEED